MIVFIWVPGQVGVRGKLAADSAARDALDGDISDELIPFSDLKTGVNKYVLELWQFRREEFLHNRLHKIFAKVYFNARYLLQEIFLDYIFQHLKEIYIFGSLKEGNDRADRLAGKTTPKSGLLLGRSVVLRSLRHYLRAQSQGHHTINSLEKRGVERGSARRSSLKGRDRAIVNQTNVGTVSKATLGKRLRDGVGCNMGFSQRIDTILTWSELNRMIMILWFFFNRFLCLPIFNSIFIWRCNRSNMYPFLKIIF